MSHRLSDGTRRNQWGHIRNVPARNVDGSRDTNRRPSHVVSTVKRFKEGKRPHTKSMADGTDVVQYYAPPVLANPGNLIRCTVGGGQIGSKLAHENEAPFPEKLAEFFIRSFCPPGGIVLDPFVGSGTTLAVALKTGRQGVGIDVRESQVSLAQRRVDSVQPEMF